MLTLYNCCKHYLAMRNNDEEGQTMVEYVMLIVLVAVAVFIASPTVTDAVMGVFNGTSSMLEDGMSS